MRVGSRVNNRMAVSCAADAIYVEPFAAGTAADAQMELQG